ncbi:MAG: DNA-binding response regulator [Caldilineae bacterium]|nr:MAG: DNA-binding response regulator [Caldilineae bacterium]
MERKILVVDDDKKTVDLIKVYLEREGYVPLVAYDGRQALEIAQTRKPDLIVLDLMLPEVDGLDVCRILRNESKVPIIMLTARTTQEDKLLGLDMGADDYVTKPFSPLELMARIRAVLRRINSSSSPDEAQIRVGGLTIDPLRHEVRLGDRLIHLTPKEFKLLDVMARSPGRVFPRTELLERAFGFNYEGLERTVDVHIMNLRRKIEPDPSSPTYIHTVYGVGYKLEAQEDVA